MPFYCSTRRRGKGMCGRGFKNVTVKIVAYGSDRLLYFEDELGNLLFINLVLLRRSGISWRDLKEGRQAEIDYVFEHRVLRAISVYSVS